MISLINYLKKMSKSMQQYTSKSMLQYISKSMQQ